MSFIVTPNDDLEPMPDEEAFIAEMRAAMPAFWEKQGFRPVPGRPGILKLDPSLAPVTDDCYYCGKPIYAHEESVHLRLADRDAHWTCVAESLCR